MIKSIYTFSFLSLFTINAIAQNRSINFEHVTFAEIKAKALKENKLIFIDAYTTWCGPCKKMAKDVFTNNAVADYYNANLVNAKIDMEKGEGIEIAKQYEVKCYPNLLFIDGNGNLVHRIAGSMSSKEFIALAQDAKQPEKQFSNFAKNYEANKADADFLLKYIEARESTCLESDELVKDYFALQKEENLINKANWEMIVYHINDIDSKIFNHVITHKKQFEELYTEKAVNGKILGVCENALNSIIRKTSFDEKKYNETKLKIESFNLPNTKLIFVEADMSLAEKTSNWEAFVKLAVANVDKYYLKDADKLNSIAWTFYEKVTDTESLSKAENWAKTACDLNKNYANMDTYAAVLYKSGKKELALKAANDAIIKAIDEKMTVEEYKSTTELVEKIKALK